MFGKRIKLILKELNQLSDTDNEIRFDKRIPNPGYKLNQLTKKINLIIAVTDNLLFKLKSSTKDSIKASSILNEKAIKVEENSRIITKEINEIEKRMESLLNTVYQSVEYGKEIFDSSNQISSQIEKQTLAVEDSSAAVIQMLASIRNITKTSGEKLETINHLNEIASQSMQNVTRNEAIINEVAGNIDQIQSFIEIINNISDLTNLLAMNAAIEAAHAGEAGRGFSVVADEIRKLAGNTGQNAKNISNNLKVVIDGIKEAQEISSNVTHSYNLMFNDMKDFSDGISQISHGLEEISAGTGEVDKSLSQLKEITNQVEASSIIVKNNSSKISGALNTAGELSAENTGYIENITNKVENSNDLIKDFSRISSSNQKDLEALMTQVDKIKITDFSSLKSDDNQPLLVWNNNIKNIPPRPKNPKDLDKFDTGYWWDEEFACFFEKKLNEVKSKVDGATGKVAAVFIPGEHPYYKALKRGMLKIAEITKIKLDITIGDWSEKPQASFFEKVYNSNYDMVLVSPANITLFEKEIKKCWEMRIPLIAMQEALSKESYRYIVGYTGFDDWETQHVLAEYFADNLNQKGGYCIVGHLTGSGYDTVRSYAFSTKIKSYAPEMKLLEMSPSDLEFKKTYEMVVKWIKSHGEALKGIFVADSVEPLKGTIKACEDMKRPDIIIYTAGNNTYATDMIIKGKCHGTSWTSPEADGAIALESAYNWFNGIKVDLIHYLPIKVLTQRDIKNYLPAQW